MYTLVSKCKQRLVLVGDDKQVRPCTGAFLQIGVMGAAFSARNRTCGLFGDGEYAAMQLARATYTRLMEAGVPAVQLQVSEM